MKIEFGVKFDFEIRTDINASVLGMNGFYGENGDALISYTDVQSYVELDLDIASTEDIIKFINDNAEFVEEQIKEEIKNKIIANEILTIELNEFSVIE